MTFPYKIRTSKWKTLGLLLICLAFVIGGIWMGGFWGWFNVIFFGLGVLVFAVQTWPDSSRLLLTEKGFIIRSMFREHMCEWKDCGPFYIDNLGGSRFVVYKFSPDYKGHPLLKKVSSITDIGAIPGSYTMSLDDLAKKMNSARTAARRLAREAGESRAEAISISDEVLKVPHEAVQMAHEAGKVAPDPNKLLTKR